MILGIGSDLIDIRSIERSLERYGERFIVRLFTDVERARSERRKARAASYAKRFAAKEACAKAFSAGTSIRHHRGGCRRTTAIFIGLKRPNPVAPHGTSR